MSIPIYVDELAKSVTDRLSMLEDGEYFDFAFLTDPHNCVDYVERSLYAAVKIFETYPLEFFCFGGDCLCNNPYTKREEALCQHRELAEVIKKYKDNK